MDDLTNDGLEWRLRGPDRDRAVWLDLPLETFNLGALGLVRERIEEFLTGADFAARQVEWAPWTLTETAGNVVLSWTAADIREDIDLGHLGPVAAAFSEWLVKSDAE